MAFRYSNISYSFYLSIYLLQTQHLHYTCELYTDPDIWLVSLLSTHVGESSVTLLVWSWGVFLQLKWWRKFNKSMLIIILCCDGTNNMHLCLSCYSSTVYHQTDLHRFNTNLRFHMKTGFFWGDWGSPRWQKCCPSSPNDRRPHALFDQNRKFQKCYLIFLSILTTFQIKTASESSTLCLKHQNLL